VKFLDGERLWLLLAVGGILVWYLVVQRQRRQYAVRFTNVDLLASVAPKRPGWRRHVAAAALLLTVAALVLAWARPTWPVKVPRERATVVLAIDVSTSMAARDISPSRFRVARDAAINFVEGAPNRFRIGLVAFSGSASVAVPPTRDHQRVERAIENLELSDRTAIGEGIFASLNALEDVPVKHGRRPEARVVVLSDGDTNTGRSNEQGAQAAVRRHVPISTIAFGTENGVVTVQGETIPVTVNREALRAIAETTGGKFFDAESAEQLRSVYADLGTAISSRTERRPVTEWFVGAGVILALAGSAAALAWTSRLP
jgi:Ca-activated chloride channel family protein